MLRYSYMCIVLSYVVLILSGCVYDINGKTFLSSKEALEFQRQQLAQQVSMVEERKNRVGESCVVNIIQSEADKVVSELNEFFVTKNELLKSELIRSLEKSKLFKSVSISNIETGSRVKKNQYQLSISDETQLQLIKGSSKKSVNDVAPNNRLDTLIDKVEDMLIALNPSMQKKIEDSDSRSEGENDVYCSGVKIEFDKKRKQGIAITLGTDLNARTKLVKAIVRYCSELSLLDIEYTGLYEITDEKLSGNNYLIEFQVETCSGY